MINIRANGTSIKTTRPGYDVTTTSPIGVSFDSARGKCFSGLIRGSVAYSAFTVTRNTSDSTSSQSTRQYVVNFGMTLPVAPIVMLSVLDPRQTDGAAVTSNYQDSLVYIIDNGDFAQGAGGEITINAITTLTTMTISIDYVVFTANPYYPATPTFVNYVVARIG